MDQLASELGVKRQTVYNKIANGSLTIPTYVDGQRFCDYRDLAAYFDECRARAKLQIN